MHICKGGSPEPESSRGVFVILHGLTFDRLHINEKAQAQPFPGRPASMVVVKAASMTRNQSISERQILPKR